MLTLTGKQVELLSSEARVSLNVSLRIKLALIHYHTSYTCMYYLIQALCSLTVIKSQAIISIT